MIVGGGGGGGSAGVHLASIIQQHILSNQKTCITTNQNKKVYYTLNTRSPYSGTGSRKQYAGASSSWWF